MHSEADPLVGVVLGGAYQLVGRIGEGGMGAVYEAHHLRLRKRVAVKVLSRAKAKDDEALARFQREAAVASRLGHPNLVSVLDFGSSSEGQPYLVMEFLEGEDLDRRIRRAGVLPLASAIRIARQVAAAVAAVHTKGIVHRDLTPANVFLVHVPGEPEFVKVLDFGVSKMKADQTRVTDASRTVGTPAYMSPEQAFGPTNTVDHRADQWALACIVWEMLSGHPPFCADDIDALFYQLRNLAPSPLGNEVPDLPPAVEPVLLHALGKQPSDRYPSIRDFMRELEIAALGNQSEIAPIALASPADSTERTIVAEARLDWAIAVGAADKARAIGALLVRCVKRIDIKTRIAIIAGAVTGIAIVAILVGSGPRKPSVAPPKAMVVVPIPASPAPLPSAHSREAPLAPFDRTRIEATNRAESGRELRQKESTGNRPRSTAARARQRGPVSKTNKGKGGLKLTIDDF